MTAFLRIAPAVLFTTAAFAQNLQINEVRTDQFSTDNDEYFEIVGPPGFSLDGYGYVVIGDGGGAGIGGGIDAAISLDGYVIPADGYLLVAESSFTLGVADYTTSLNFENSDNVTHILVEGTLPASGDDLDTDDDGVIDAAPWNSVIDGIALVETPASGELYYDNLPNTVAIGPNGNFVPCPVYRCGNDFRVGDFFDLGDFLETPGDPNICSAPTGVFCSPAVANSVSMAGSLLALSSASGGSIAANDSSLVVTDTPDDFGIFAQSMSVMAPVRLSSGGDLCLGYPDSQRLSAPIMASGNTASLALDFTSGPASGVATGVTMYYQWWHRDMATGGSNLSEGLSITWLE